MGWLDWLFGKRRGRSSPSIAEPAPRSSPPVARTPPLDPADDGIGGDIARLADRLIAEKSAPRPRTDRAAERIIDVVALRDALAELGRVLHGQGLTVDLAVYGGSCLMLASNFRQSSGDVDAVTFHEDWSVIQGPANAIAEKRGWPLDWINNNVQNFLGDKPLDPAHHILEGSYPDPVQPGLRVFVPTAQYALAMKLRAIRIDFDNDKDLDDIINLMIAAEVKDKGELVAIGQIFYPVREFGGKLYAALDNLWKEYGLAKERLKHDPPRYLG